MAWNDLVDFAFKYALELTRSVTYAEWVQLAPSEDDASTFAEATRALARVAVLVGAVRIVRDTCESEEIPSELITFPLSLILSTPERRVYLLKETKPFDMSSLHGIKPVVSF